MNRKYYILHIILTSILYGGCDTEENVPPANAETFVKFYGGEFAEQGFDLLQTSDGGFFIVGTSNSKTFGENWDIFMVKTDSFGITQWNDIVGGTGEDIGRSVKSTPDGGFIVVGDYTQEDGNKDIILIKLDSRGNQQWLQTYDNTKDSIQFVDQGFAVDVNDQGGYLVIGSTLPHRNITASSDSSDIIALNIDSNGQLIRMETEIGFSGNDYGKSFVFDRSDQNYAYFLGTTDTRADPTQSGTNVFIGVINRQLSRVSALRLGTDQNEEGVKLIYSNDDQLIALGTILQNNNNRIYLAKYRFTGTNWIKGFEQVISSNNLGFTAENIILTTDGYVILATEKISALTSNWVMIKTNFNGEEQWKRNFGGDFHDKAAAVVQSQDRGFVATGQVSFSASNEKAKMCLVKTNSEGEMVPN